MNLSMAFRGSLRRRVDAATLLASAGIVAALMIGPMLTGRASAAGGQPEMLPAGYLSTHGSQIVDSHGNPVRIACMGGFGTDIVGGTLDYGNGPYKTLDANIAALSGFGFNCIRADFNDKSVGNRALMKQFDELVAACKKYGVKVIFDHHNDEATANDWGNAAQQTNGLWYDKGPGTYGTDGAQGRFNNGTVTREIFKQDWVTLAERYAGNDTVIGFDLDNEPHIGYGTPDNGENWGLGGPGDIWAMYEDVGNAIQKVDPGALIICEGLMDITDKSSNIWWTMDLAHVATKPVVLNLPNKVVYSPHEYSNMRNGGGGDLYIKRLNECWGYLVSGNIAPVWIGELGEVLRPDDKSTVDWANTILPYIDGKDGSMGGPTFTSDEQPISTDIWRWGCQPDTGDGVMDSDGQIRPEIKDYVDGLLFRPS